MPERQSIRKNIGWLALGNVVVKPLWLVLLLLTARLLGASDFGKFMLAISFVSVASVMLEGGVDILTVRELSNKPDEFRKFFGHTATIKIASGILSSIAAIAASFLLKMGREITVLVIFASLYSISNTLLLHFRSIFRSFEVLKYEAISMILEKGAVIILCGGILLMHMGLRAYMAGYVVAYVITSIATFVIVGVKIGLPTFHPQMSYLWQNVLKPALPFAVLNLFTVIYFRSGTLMLGALTGREELVGYYNAGYKLVESFMLFPTIIVAPIYPVISRNRENSEQIKRVIVEAARVLLLIGVSVGFMIFLFREKATLLLFGKGYELASNSVGILALTMIPISVNFGAGTLVAALDRQGKSNIFVLTVTLLNLVLNYFMIMKLAVLGAVLTTVITETLLVLCNLFVVHDYIPWRKLIDLSARSIVPAVLAGLLLLTPARELTFPLQVGLVVIAMLGGYLALKVLTFGDFRTLWRIAV
jgi:O-antigen/teichoic acid export membrane protein